MPEEQQPQLTFEGRVLEAWLWFGLSFLCLVAGLYCFYVAVFGWPIWHPPKPVRLSDAIPAAIAGVVGAGMFLWVARVRGMSVVVSSKDLFVREWYGREFLLSLQQPVRVDRKVDIRWPSGSSVEIRMPLQLAFRLKTGDHQVYLNCGDEVSEEERVDELERFLARGAVHGLDE